MWLRATAMAALRKGGPTQMLDLLSMASYRVQPASCWSCHVPVSEVLCQSCGKVQPAQGEANYFRVLGQEETFALNVAQLQRKFRELQRVLHPDKFANCSEEEKTYSADQSALVNQAYQVLLKPIQRATYLLKINGITLDDVKLPSEFLFEMMDFNEKIDEAAGEQERGALLEQVKLLQEATLADLQQSFSNKQTTKASEHLAKLKYFDNLAERLAKKS